MTPRNGPWRITFDTNPDDCNLSCVMCEGFSRYAVRHFAERRRMDFRIIEKVVREMVPEGLAEIIPSTMGEPLLYERFRDMLTLCRDCGIAFNLTTNGTWPGSPPETWAELICPVTRDVKVSWNGSTKNTQEEIMPGSKFEKRLDYLRRFIKVRDEMARAGGKRCSVTLQCTFMEKNLAELPSLVVLASRLGVDRVKGHHLWVNFPWIKNQDLRRNRESRQRWNGIVEECRKTAAQNQLPSGSIIQLDNFNPLPSNSAALDLNWRCPFLGREAWINSEGRFDPCCAPDAERQELGCFGNVTESGFKELWHSEAYDRLRRNYMSSSLCVRCTMRRPFRHGWT